MLKKIKYLAYVATSIDGRISKNSQSEIDWTSKEDWNFFQKALSKVDAVIVGHNTYKVAEKSLKKRQAIVLTSRVNKIRVDGKTTFFNPKKNNLKKLLQDRKYKKVAILGGAKVYNFCLINKMLDELFVTIEPYVFTSGVPMFFSNKFRKYKFSLQSVKKLNSKGTLLLRYKYEN